MTERVGQYYFDIKGENLVNEGKMIELNDRGHERWPSWKSIGWGLSAIGIPFGAIYVGLGIGWKIAEQLVTKTDIVSIIGKGAAEWGTAGLVTVGAVTAMGAALMTMEILGDKIRRSTPKQSFS